MDNSNLEQMMNQWMTKLSEQIAANRVEAKNDVDQIVAKSDLRFYDLGQKLDTSHKGLESKLDKVEVGHKELESRVEKIDADLGSRVDSRITSLQHNLERQVNEVVETVVAQVMSSVQSGFVDEKREEKREGKRVVGASSSHTTNTATTSKEVQQPRRQAVRNVTRLGEVPHTEEVPRTVILPPPVEFYYPDDHVEGHEADTEIEPPNRTDRRNGQNRRDEVDDDLSTIKS